MANKYIRHGETYCGDGTSPDAATSNGGVGAWNNINVFEGTAPAYGALVVGDVVYIRSKDAANAALTFTPTAAKNLGNSSGTLASPINWIFDSAGTVWSGVTGAITYTQNRIDPWRVAVVSNNNVYANSANGIVVQNLYTNPYDVIVLKLNTNSSMTNVYIDCTNQNGGYGQYIELCGPCTLENPVFSVGKLSLSSNTGVFTVGTTSNGSINVINPTVVLANVRVGGQAIFRTLGNYNGVFSVVGGSVGGDGATTGQPLITVQGWSNTAYVGEKLSIVGLAYPKEMTVFAAGIEPTNPAVVADIVGADASGGAHYESGFGFLTSRTDNNPPYLSGVLPDGANTPWAWRAYPRGTTNNYPLKHTIVGFYQDTAATRTITQEVLIEGTMTPNVDNTWITVSYTDSSGVKRSESSRAPGSTAALTASTASWSTTSWALSTFVKKKLSVTTAYAIKQGTIFTVTFNTTMNAGGNASRVLFINPDVSVA